MGDEATASKNCNGNRNILREIFFRIFQQINWELKLSRRAMSRRAMARLNKTVAKKSATRKKRNPIYKRNIFEA